MKLNKNKEEIEFRIIMCESRSNGLNKISGGYVEVYNLKIMKKLKRVIADVVLSYPGDSDVINKFRYNNCEYSFDKLGIIEINA